VSRFWRTPTVVSSVSSHPPPLPRGRMVRYPGRTSTAACSEAPSSRAAASQISRCRVLSLFDYCTRPRPSPALPDAVTRGTEGLLGCECRHQTYLILLSYATSGKTTVGPCQLHFVGIFSLYHAGYAWKDSGIRECKQQPSLDAKQLWGNPQTRRSSKYRSWRVSRAHGKVGVPASTCMHAYRQLVEPARTGMIPSHKPSPSVYTCLRSISLQPQPGESARS